MVARRCRRATAGQDALQEFYARVRRKAGLAFEREARQATRVVFAALKEQLSLGEADDIVAQLPKDLKAASEAA